MMCVAREEDEDLEEMKKVMSYLNYSTLEYTMFKIYDKMNEKENCDAYDWDNDYFNLEVQATYNRLLHKC